MKYELALELKNAGFSQGGSIELFCYTCKEENPMREHTSDETERLRVPTLEELIEMCGKSLEKLENKNNWIASGHSLNRKPDWQYHNDPYEFYVCEGLTQTEAVANLYLQLKKKNQ